MRYRGTICLAAALGAAFLCAPSAAAQLACAAREAVVGHLSRAYSEAPSAAGVTGSGALVELYVAPARPGKSPTWSLIVTLPDGRACLLAAGEGWASLPATIPMKGDDA